MLVEPIQEILIHHIACYGESETRKYGTYFVSLRWCNSCVFENVDKILVESVLEVLEARPDNSFLFTVYWSSP